MDLTLLFSPPCKKPFKRLTVHGWGANIEAGISAEKSASACPPQTLTFCPYFSLPLLYF
jgi:hypothetical protein